MSLEAKEHEASIYRVASLLVPTKLLYIFIQKGQRHYNYKDVSCNCYYDN